MEEKEHLNLRQLLYCTIHTRRNNYIATFLKFQDYEKSCPERTRRTRRKIGKYLEA